MRHQKVDRIATEAAKFESPESFIDIYGREFLRGADWKRRIDQVVARDKFRCGLCNRMIDPEFDIWDVHHAPVSRGDGGSDDLANLMQVHRECHNRVGHPTKQVRWSSQEIQ